MRESCFCGRRGELEDREPILDAQGGVGASVPRLWPLGLFDLALGGGRSPRLGRGETPTRDST
jgi:hypothetical protein